MNKRKRRSALQPPDETNAGALHMIRILLILLGCAILGGMAFETVLGIAPNPIEVLGIVVLVILIMWIHENA
jgi:hypothetical protein